MTCKVCCKLNTGSNDVQTKIPASANARIAAMRSLGNAAPGSHFNANASSRLVRVAA